MERWPIAQRIFCVEQFIRTSSYVLTKQLFRREFHTELAPSRKTVARWVRNYRRTGSVDNIRVLERVKRARTEANILQVRNFLDENENGSVRRISQHIGISRESARLILKKDLDFHPYKWQKAQKLLPADHNARLEFCQWILQRGAGFLNNLIMTDESHFQLHGERNKQNLRFWAAENPHIIVEQELHPQKVTVWCGICSFGILGPYFFEDERGNPVTVNSERYVEMLQTFLLDAIRQLQLPLDVTWYQQDGARPHTSNMSMEVLREMFPGRLLSQRGDQSWPARSPDLSALDFFLWGYVKSKVFQNRPQNLDDLKNNIREVIAEIPVDMCRRTMASVLHRAQICTERNGGHLTNVIFKY